MHIDPNLNLGNILSILTALVSIFLAVGRLSAKIDRVSDDVKGLGEELRTHAHDDRERFDELGKVVYRLSGKIGNGGA